MKPSLEYGLDLLTQVKSVCLVLIHRPRQVVASSYTVHHSFLVAALLRFFFQSGWMSLTVLAGIS